MHSTHHRLFHDKTKPTTDDPAAKAKHIKHQLKKSDCFRELGKFAVEYLPTDEIHITLHVTKPVKLQCFYDELHRHKIIFKTVLNSKLTCLLISDNFAAFMEKMAKTPEKHEEKTNSLKG